jgi:thiol-disulfide isomerase/thioredoxin
VAAILSALLIGGCNRNEQPPPDEDSAGGPAAWTDASVKPAQPWSGKVDVATGDWEAFQKLVDSHKGKIVVAGFWASWSEKIVPQIRHLARLQNKYPDKIVVIQVAVDPEAMRPELEKLVREWVGPELPDDATVQLFISSQIDEEFYKAANTIEAVPTIFVYHQSGKRKSRVTIFLGGEQVIDGGLKVVPVIEEMLK